MDMDGRTEVKAKKKRKGRVKKKELDVTPAPERVERRPEAYLCTETGYEEGRRVLACDQDMKDIAFCALVELLPYLNLNPSAVFKGLSDYTREAVVAGDIAAITIGASSLRGWVAEHFIRDFPLFSARIVRNDKSEKAQTIVIDMIEELFALIDLLSQIADSGVEAHNNALKLATIKGFASWKGGECRSLPLQQTRSDGALDMPRLGRRGSSSGLFKSIFGRKKSSPQMMRKKVKRSSSVTSLMGASVTTADELEERVDLVTEQASIIQSQLLGRVVKPAEVANALTKLARGYLVKVAPLALVRKNWTRPEFGSVASVKALTGLQELFNQIGFWVAAAVCRVPDIALRGGMIEFFIEIASECEKMNNFSSMMAVMSGLNNVSISRMKRAWVEVLPDNLARWHELMDLMNTKNNYGAFRQRIASIEGGYIPFTGILTRDMTFIEEGNSYWNENEGGERELNVEKFFMVATVICELQRAKREYDLPPWTEEIVGYLMMDIRRPLPEEQDDILYELSQKFEKKITSEEEWKKERKRRKRRASELTMKANLF